MLTFYEDMNSSRSRLFVMLAAEASHRTWCIVWCYVMRTASHFQCLKGRHIADSGGGKWLIRVERWNEMLSWDWPGKEWRGIVKRPKSGLCVGSLAYSEYRNNVSVFHEDFTNPVTETSRNSARSTACHSRSCLVVRLAWVVVNEIIEVS